MTSINRNFSRGSTHTLQLLLLILGIGYCTGCAERVDKAKSASLPIPSHPLQEKNPFSADDETDAALKDQSTEQQQMAAPISLTAPPTQVPIVVKQDSAAKAAKPVVSVLHSPATINDPSEGNLVELPLNLQFSADVFSSYQPALEEYSYESYALENHSFIVKPLSSFSIDGELLMNEDVENYIESVEGAQLNFKWEM